MKALTVAVTSVNSSRAVWLRATMLRPQGNTFLRTPYSGAWNKCWPPEKLQVTFAVRCTEEPDADLVRLYVGIGWNKHQDANYLPFVCAIS